MALTHSPIESDRLKTMVMTMMIAMVAAMLMGVGWLTRPSPVLAVPSVQPSLGLMERGPVVVGFAQDMSLHHEQALTMAGLALKKGSVRVKGLAQGMLFQQLKEIGYMQGWLMLWQAPGIAASSKMTWMRDAYARAPRRDAAYEQFIDRCIKGGSMPGLVSPDELQELANAATPLAFDTLFLSLMVRHHQGAVVMARFTSEYAELELVRGFARAVAAEQQLEMAQMLKWLKT